MNSKVTLAAIELLGQWNRISQVHLALGSGCMCAGSMPGLAVSDLEINILDFLKEKYFHEQEWTIWLKKNANYQEGLAGSVSEMLKNFALQAPSPPLAQKVLKDLRNTISSLMESHKG